ncbi:anti-sigma factor [Neorhizobium sp. SOG26]|uniref:anti-sigma factor n=1 Tax=Neorhizobium sp. SOG26 TaxID=2060726 RepID=UPI000E597422|nr:anti-sigma factor [Neorhizobium sp. SOG26]AXV14295.1 anti-sigma factor [Neorhizobium sp. SOG26]
MSRPEQSEGDRSRDELLAGEYVLGVLSQADRARVEARLRQDKTFARIVARWQENLADFNGDYMDETPPDAVFSRIEARLFGPQPGQQKSVAQELAAAGSWWNSLLLWRSLTFASLALLVTYVSLQSGWIGAREPATPLVAQMSSTTGNINLLAQYDAGSGQLKVTPVASKPNEPRSLELWLVPDSTSLPISLGVLPEAGDGSVEIPAALRAKVREGVTFAVSLEPFGGSPTGQATGPVIAAGQAAAQK